MYIVYVPRKKREWKKEWEREKRDIESEKKNRSYKKER